MTATGVPAGHLELKDYKLYISKNCNGELTEFVWQGNRLVAQTRSHNHDWQTFVYEPGTHRPLALLDGHRRDNPHKAAPKVYWYQLDHLGTPQGLTDIQGRVVYTCKYNAYGKLSDEWFLRDEESGERLLKIRNPLRFQGQYEDEESGLFYNLNRYYEPSLGRYLTQDPVGLMGGLNPYAYVDGNPVGWVDPLGLLKTENTGFESINANPGAPELVDIYRAVGPDELSDIQFSGAFNNVTGIETKYFTTSGEKASEYAKKAVSAFGDEPYTIVKAEIPKNTLDNPIFFAEVDGGIPAYVLPSNILLNLKPIVLNYSPVPGK